MLSYTSKYDMLDLSFINDGNLCHWISSISFMTGIILFRPTGVKPRSEITKCISDLSRGNVYVKKILMSYGHRVFNGMMHDPTEHLLITLNDLIPFHERWCTASILRYVDKEGRRMTSEQNRQPFVFANVAIHGSSILESLNRHFNASEGIELSQKYDPPMTIEKIKTTHLSFTTNIPTFLPFTIKRWDNKGHQILTQIEEQETFDFIVYCKDGMSYTLTFSLISIIYKCHKNANNGHYTCLLRIGDNRFLHVNDSVQHIYSNYEEWQTRGLDKSFMYGYVYVYGIKHK